ncbi:dfg16p [Saccharomyces arboricola H-6]|uniref:Dfg16p n=1 Tax=Saccharomyces arboricola (strain H-6 / AS 2.3317 / CBS 10644) TaxID=1160507 RepID=J8Q2A9_SACAR|nr:dfg16p [Saccharomyces arboricola H-6]
MNIRLHFHYLLILIYNLGLINAHKIRARERIQSPRLQPAPPRHIEGDERPPDLDHRPGYYGKHVGHIPTNNLTDLINDRILNKYGNSCSANILSSGFVLLNSNLSHLHAFNYTLNYPSFLIRCNSDNTDFNYSQILQNFAHDISNNPNIQDNSVQYVGKDSFTLGMIMITFATGCICVATWMLFLIVLLLPSDNHNRREKLVHIYVLFYAIVRTVFLTETVAVIFNNQYHDDYQDASQFEFSIADTASYKICELVSNILSNINWIYIVHYLQSNYGKPTWNWIPFKMKKGTRFIIILGFFLSLIHNTLFGWLLWKKSLIVLKVFFIIVDLLIYTIFISVICYFTWHNFAYILLMKTAESNRDSNYKTKLKILWENYHETIPLLAYNIIIFILFYFTSIFFAASTSHTRGWTFNFVRFLNVLITVNVWGLIGVLEKRELRISKKTVLGRKINNQDKFFANPTINYYEDNSGKHISSMTQNMELYPTQSTGTSRNSSSVLISPLPTWKSPIERIKDRRRRHKMMRSKKKLEKSPSLGSKSIFNLNTRATISKYRKLLRKPRRKPNLHEQKLEILPTKKRSIDRARIVNSSIGFTYHGTDLSDNGSVETELRTNHIYNYESSD